MLLNTILARLILLIKSLSLPRFTHILKAVPNQFNIKYGTLSRVCASKDAYMEIYILIHVRIYMVHEKCMNFTFFTSKYNCYCPFPFGAHILFLSLNDAKTVTRFPTYELCFRIYFSLSTDIFRSLFICFSFLKFLWLLFVC